MTRRLLALAAALLVATGCGKGAAGAAGAQGPQGSEGQGGTSGTNGTDGTNGADGTNGTNGAAAVGTPRVEGCAVCHAASQPYDFTVRHAVTGRIAVGNVALATASNGADLQLTFQVTVDGLASDAFTTPNGAYRYALDATKTTYSSGGVTYPVMDPYVRTSLTLGSGYTLAGTGSGTYEVTLVGGVAAAGSSAATYLVNLKDAATGRIATVSYSSPAPVYTRGTDQACMSCHGDHVFASGSHHGANPQGPSACVVCHVRYDSQSRGTGGDKLMSYVHGVHNSKAMAARDLTATLTPPGGVAASYTVTKPAGTYARNDALKWDATANAAVIASPFSIGFPGYVNNCSTCHDTSDGLAAVMAAPVSWSICMSCHDGWDGFASTQPNQAGAFHRTMGSTTDCTSCHTAALLPSLTVASDFHDGLLTERGGLLWGGRDQSVEQGKRVAIAITGVARSGSTLRITWTSTLDGAAADPCNADPAAGPVFFGAAADAATGQVASNMSVLRAYAQGNDWVSAGLAGSTSPGQPSSAVTLAASNTTCAADVATTVVPAEATTATKGIVALQGKPQLLFAGNGKVIQVRALSPVREFLVADGSLPGASQQRRRIVDVAKCQACHLGSLYQHGGNRVDNVQLCVMCHNPAANEKNNRVGMGITAATSYDGKAGETYDFRYLIHAIHSAGETNAPLVYYRSNGVYAFGSQAAIDALPGWPGPGTFTVANSSPATTRTHNEIAVSYPRALNDCQACHVGGSELALPDPARSVAVTVDPGAAPWSNQLDDVLMGPSAATCMSCHQDGDPVLQATLRGHAFAAGWYPVPFANGRQSLLDVAQ